jgi:hypothetical protein
MKRLNILICGGDILNLQRTAKALADDGVCVEITSQLLDYLWFSANAWDVLLIDLDGLTSFLRSLLPEIGKKFPKLPLVGFSSRTPNDVLGTLRPWGIELDALLDGTPAPEDLIVLFPHVAAKYLCDTRPLRLSDTGPLYG